MPTKRPADPKPSRVHLRGFASMSPERQQELARKGGASVPAAKRSFSQNRDLASHAGRLGGEASAEAHRVRR
jgi:uncharacterized protein